MYAPATKELFGHKNNGCFYQRKSAGNERNIDKSLILTTTGIPHEDNGTQATLIHELSKVAKVHNGSNSFRYSKSKQWCWQAPTKKGTIFGPPHLGTVEEAGGYFRATANHMENGTS